MQNKGNKSLALPLFGIAWILYGIQTLREPVYLFKGAYVDFRGYNTEVGIVLILIGIVFVLSYFNFILPKKH